MMKSTEASEGSFVTTLVGSVLALVLLAVTGILVYMFFQLPVEVVAPTLAAVATAGVGVYSAISSRRHDLMIQIAETQRPRKVEVYEEFMKFWFNSLLAKQTGRKQPSAAEMVKFFADFTQKIISWGSDDVILEYGKFRSQNNETSTSDASQPIMQFEKLLFAIRADLGHNNAGMQQGDLLRLFVTDLDEHKTKG